MTDLVLARHGETTWHANNRYAGSSDVPLTARGYDQAETLATWAGGAGLDAVWCSTLSRARETALPSAEAIGGEPRADERLCEVDFGEGEGKSVAEMERLFPERRAAFVTDPVAHHLPGGEDPRLAVKRALACFDDIIDAHPDGRVLVVGHGTLMRLVLCRLLGLPLREYRRVFPVVRNTALTTLRMSGGRAALIEYNVPPEIAAAHHLGLSIS
ncbi:histidine phosphatase family protein [Nocardiopsis gilva YIM 90087]|uniref:Histidine phosphatase family protein n=1 Tax=Nocardiopsis gilva YIM 90087 TaxID=1235441 RepID=A0A223S8I4_9ACTN|nr:histidine phosphatase family protein [Nocardiopsis gilva]ASU84430.1 histidine phosphatase family protein [Nocardiopsis gilva YIM 90087]